MRLFLVGILSTFSLFAQASSDSPRFLLFGGGSALRVHASGSEAGAVVGVPDYVLQPQHNLNFNLYGWNAAVTEEVKPWFGADIDFSGQYGTPAAPFLCQTIPISSTINCLSKGTPHASVVTKLHTFTFGPRFTLHRYERFRPYFHVLVGYAFLSGSLSQSAIFTPIPTLIPQDYSKSNGAFAVAPGGGVDLRMGSRVAVRLFELDYFMTRFYSQRQDNARLSAGIVFQFSGRGY